MRQIKYKWYSDNNIVGSERSGTNVIEVDDNATDQEIEDLVKDDAESAVFNHFEWGFEIIGSIHDNPDLL